MSSTVTVSNSVQLAAALKAAATATTPETIVLAAGTYSGVNIYKYNPTASVTIESASSSNKADIQGLTIQNSANFTFNDVTFTAPTSAPTGDIAKSYFNKNVNFLNDSFVGRATNTYSSAPFEGLVTEGSTNTTVSGNQFQFVQNGIAEEGDSSISISNNKFSDIFGDGIDNTASSNVKITGNSFTTMHMDNSDGQHSDAIQFWTSAGQPTGSNITISGNTYNIGSGNPVQGIFITSPTGQKYSNVTIENNVLVGTNWNALTLQDVSSSVVENNTLQTVSGTGFVSRLTLQGGVSGLIEGNKIGGLVTEGVNTATVSGNTTLAAISLSAAQSLVSGMASVTSSSTSATSASTAQLAQYQAYLAAHPIAAPTA